MFFFIENPFLVIAAVIPAVILLIFVYKADKVEKEPPMLLLSLILYGIISTALAMFTKRIGVKLLSQLVPEDTVLYGFILYFVIVALSEEGFKYLLLKKRTWNSPAFDCQFDGVVYAVFVSLGFALWENINYVVMYGFGTALLRAVTAVPGHACFGVFMGAFYGMAKRYDAAGQTAKGAMFRKAAFFIPALLHGLYDFIATEEYVGYTWIFVVFIIALFIASVILVRKLSGDDRMIGGRRDFPEL